MKNDDTLEVDVRRYDLLEAVDELDKLEVDELGRARKRTGLDIDAP